MTAINFYFKNIKKPEVNEKIWMATRFTNHKSLFVKSTHYNDLLELNDFYHTKKDTYKIVDEFGQTYDWESFLKNVVNNNNKDKDYAVKYLNENELFIGKVYLYKGFEWIDLDKVENVNRTKYEDIILELKEMMDNVDEKLKSGMMSFKTTNDLMHHCELYKELDSAIKIINILKLDICERRRIRDVFEEAKFTYNELMG